MIVQADTELAEEMSMAKDIAESLHTHYPGHLWAVTVRGGVAVIKALNISSLYGYILKLAHIQHDAGTRHKEVMRAGGEILERAKIKRGEYQAGNKPTEVDGIANYKPIGVH